MPSLSDTLSMRSTRCREKNSPPATSCSAGRARAAWGHRPQQPRHSNHRACNAQPLPACVRARACFGASPSRTMPQITSVSSSGSVTPMMRSGSSEGTTMGLSVVPKRGSCALAMWRCTPWYANARRQRACCRRRLLAALCAPTPCSPGLVPDVLVCEVPKVAVRGPACKRCAREWHAYPTCALCTSSAEAVQTVSSSSQWQRALGRLPLQRKCAPEDLCAARRLWRPRGPGGAAGVQQGGFPL